MSDWPHALQASPPAVSLARPSIWARIWLPAVVVLLALYAGLPWLAPVFMRLGWTAGADAIYAAYSTQCHQLPQRSLFLFGPRLMYSLSQIQSAWQDTTNPMILRQFTGSEAMGWKVAWSDRMTSMYLSLAVFVALYRPVLRRLRLPWWIFVLLLVPLAVDGVSHAASDLAGIGAGFRDGNAWLAALTNNSLPETFYAGDALGSFNSWMRLLTGLLFGLGVAGLALPQLEAAFGARSHPLNPRNNRFPPQP